MQNDVYYIYRLFSPCLFILLYWSAAMMKFIYIMQIDSCIFKEVLSMENREICHCMLHMLI